jgi:hypothetical protein
LHISDTSSFPFGAATWQTFIFLGDAIVYQIRPSVLFSSYEALSTVNAVLETVLHEFHFVPGKSGA